MITRSAPPRQAPAWRRLQAGAISDPAVLIERLGLDPGLLPAARRAADLFRLRVPEGYVDRMRRGDPGDPLLRQVLPLDAESLESAGFVDDPVGDQAAMKVPGVLHKYAGRVLLVTTGACAVHCRYCFRRHFPYGEATPGREGWGHAIDYIRAHTDVSEVILSGGDPLSMSDDRLQALVDALQGIAHLRRLRVHSRTPVVIPERVDAQLLRWLSPARLATVLVIHANHAREIHGPVRDALRTLKNSGVELLNQSVLLRGVNDRVEDLLDLSETLFEAGVLPYYLHQLDPVRGAVHFLVPDGEALALHRALSERAPGYLVPRLVREIPGAPGKTPIGRDQPSVGIT